MKTLFFLSSKEKLDRQLDIDTERAGECIYVSLSAAIDSMLESKGISFRRIEDYDGIDISLVRKYAWELIDSWGCQKVKGRSVSEHFTIKGFPFWEANRFKLYIMLIKVVKQLIIFDEILAEENPDEVFFYDPADMYYVEKDIDFSTGLLEEICRKRNIRLTVKRGVSGVIRKSVQNFLLWMIYWVTIFRQEQRRRFSDFDKESDYGVENQDRKNILFFTYGVSNMAVSDKPFMSMKEEGYHPIYICGDGPRRNKVLEHVSKEGMEYAYSENFLTRKISSDANRLAQVYRKRWNTLFNKSCNNKFMFRGYDLLDTILPALEMAFIKELYTDLRLVFAMERLVSVLKPSAGLMTNDMIFWGFTAAYALKKKGILSITLAHGPLADIYGASQINSDYMLVYSELERQRKIDSGVRPEKLKIFGTDSYNRLLSRFGSIKREDVLRSLGISSKKRIVLFPCKVPVEKDFPKINRLDELFREEKDITVIIKLHPSDVSISLDNLRSRFSSKSIIFIRDIPFYKLLRAADLVISHSTCRTALDSIIFGVPLIIWDPPDRLNEDSVCKIPFDEKMDLFVRLDSYDAFDKKLIHRLLADKGSKASKQSLGKKYHKKYYSGVDLNVLDNLIKNVAK